MIFTEAFIVQNSPLGKSEMVLKQFSKLDTFTVTCEILIKIFPCLFVCYLFGRKKDIVIKR